MDLLRIAMVLVNVPKEVYDPVLLVLSAGDMKRGQSFERLVLKLTLPALHGLEENRRIIFDVPLFPFGHTGEIFFVDKLRGPTG